MTCLSPRQPKLTLENSLITRFSEEGEVPVTVQASNGRSMVQDSKTVIVYGKIKHRCMVHSISGLERFTAEFCNFSIPQNDSLLLNSIIHI